MRNAHPLEHFRRSRLPVAASALALAAFVSGCAKTPSPAGPPLTGSAMDLYVEGALAYRTGNKQRAEQALDAALSRDPHHIMAHTLKATLLRERGDYAAAAQQFQRVTELDPYVAQNHYNLGLMYHYLNRLQEAAAAYLQALNLNPQDVKSNTNLGVVYVALGKPELGLDYARRAVEMDTKSAEAWANFGVVLDALTRHADAEIAYRRALELDPERVETSINLAGNLASQNRYKDAITVYETVLTKSDLPMLRQRYGYALFRAGRYEDAISQFQLTLKSNPRSTNALNGIGDALLAQYHQSAMLDEKKRTGAVGYWKQSLEVNAEQPRIAALVKEYTNNRLFP